MKRVNSARVRVPVSDNQKEKQSISMKGKNLGKKHPLEFGLKISEAKKGQKYKMSLNKRKEYSAEYKQILRERRLGKKLSLESLEKRKSTRKSKKSSSGFSICPRCLKCGRSMKLNSITCISCNKRV